MHQTADHVTESHRGYSWWTPAVLDARLTRRAITCRHKMLLFNKYCRMFLKQTHLKYSQNLCWNSNLADVGIFLSVWCSHSELSLISSLIDRKLWTPVSRNPFCAVINWLMHGTLQEFWGRSILLGLGSRAPGDGFCIRDPHKYVFWLWIAILKGTYTTRVSTSQKTLTFIQCQARIT